MRYKLAVIIVVMIGCVIFVGCNTEPNNQDKDNEIDKNKEVSKDFIWLTREYLYETYGITDEDLEGIEFDLIVAQGPLSVNSIEKTETKESVMMYFIDDQEKLDKERRRIANDKTYLLNAPTFEGEIPTLSGLKYLSLEMDALSETADKIARFIDFDEGVFYYDGAQSIVADLESVHIQIALNETVLEECINDLEELNIREWEQVYDENSPHGNWYLGLEFETGEIITFHGTFNEDGGYPDTYRELIEMLQDLEDDNMGMAVLRYQHMRDEFGIYDELDRIDYSTIIELDELRVNSLEQFDSKEELIEYFEKRHRALSTDFIWLTREYLYETYGVTDQDLRGIEFELIVEQEVLGESSFDATESKEVVLWHIINYQEELEEERERIEND